MGKGIVDELKKDFDIEDTWLPLEIHPDTPVEGKKLTDIFPKNRLEAMSANLKNYGAEFGIKFNQSDLLSNSHLSLIAGEFTRDNGKFHEYHEAVFKAYFSDGEDIGKVDVITRILKRLNLDVDNFLAEAKKGTYEERLQQASSAAHVNQINSTPTFIVNDKYAIVGAQPIESFRRALLDMKNETI